MPERPDPPPWGALITAALRRTGTSARAAAREAGISEGRWRQITSGYQVVSPGVYAPVRGPSATLARMAAAAGVSPAQLRAADRDDAAQILAAGAATRDAAGQVTDDQLMERIRSMKSDEARDLLAQIAVQLGISVAAAPAPAAGQAEGARRYGT